MKKFVIAGFIALLLGIATVTVAQESKPENATTDAQATPKMPEMPKPQKEHEWLKQLEGEWETEAEMTMDPSKPPVKSTGTESVKMLGGFWAVSENNGQMPFDNQPFKGILTLGFDPAKNKYVGTWVDSMNSRLWTYEGDVDESGKKLTLNTEGPCPMAGGKIMKMKEVMEITDADHKVFTSSVQMEDGKWMTPMTIRYTRKK